MSPDLTTPERIMDKTVPLLARFGYSGTSIRAVAEAAQLKQSVLYYYFSNKAALLQTVRHRLNAQLDDALRALPESRNTAELLRQRIKFQFTHREAIVCLLQYFMAAKQDFPLQADGYVPERAYRHMREIIDAGLREGCYHSADPAFDAKTLTHLINGFLMEYYPHALSPGQEDALTEQLARFIERSLGVRQS